MSVIPCVVITNRQYAFQTFFAVQDAMTNVNSKVVLKASWVLFKDLIEINSTWWLKEGCHQLFCIDAKLIEMVVEDMDLDRED